MVADASTAVAAFASWHEVHAAASRALGPTAGIVAHAAIESYSVLTRLPPPHRASGDVVAEYLRRRFARRWIGLSVEDQRDMLASFPSLGVTGGATYDALIGAAAALANATLVSCDERALTVYAAVGADVDLLP
ncbi:MAG: PIN domain-containing protein [Actinomycetota bacterium]